LNKLDILLKSALETFPNFIIVDDMARIVYLNESYAQLLGTTSKVAVGKNVKDVIPNTRLNIIVKTGKEEIGSIMTLFDHENKQNITLVCNRIPILEDGKIVGAVAATTMSDLFEVTKLSNEIEEMKKENKYYKSKLTAIEANLNPLEKIIGASESIEIIKKTIQDYADSNLAFLITGETGVGKEVFAKAIHQMSLRSLNNYVKINCAAIPSNLLESELFGYADGAFTGAIKGGKMGKFELADKGTILLDEIAEMPLELQVKLLRVLQENEFERVGSLKTTKFNARIICSTNRDIEELAEKGLFRQDLYYRINIIELYIPPLRERYDDILPLCKHFITNLNQDGNKKIIDIDARVLDLFRQYDWPGNVRELKHVIERAYVTCKEEILSLDYLDFFKDRIVRQKNKSDSAPPDATLREHRHQAEKQAIIQALKQAKGNKTKAAQLLQIDRSRLYYKLKKFNLDL